MKPNNNWCKATRTKWLVGRWHFYKRSENAAPRPALALAFKTSCHPPIQAAVERGAAKQSAVAAVARGKRTHSANRHLPLLEHAQNGPTDGASP